MSSRCIITYAAGGHEELLDVSAPTYADFAKRHSYDFIIGERLTDLPPAWNKIPLLLFALQHYEEAVWFDCDLIVTDPTSDFPPMVSDPSTGRFTGHASHSLVRHFAWDSEVPNSGVWRVRTEAISLLNAIMELSVFTDHGWWEQAALLTLMGYTVPPQGSDFRETHCRCVHKTRWYNECQFMRLKFNSHPNYRAEHPVIVHCSYTNMQERLEVMRALVRNPHYDYPRYNVREESEEDDNALDS